MSSRPDPHEAWRGQLYGDVPLADLVKNAGGRGVWEQFERAAARLDSRDVFGARDALNAILATPGLESRHYLQAWHGLRGLGWQPPDGHRKHLYGVVLDIWVPGGRDTLAAYEDGSCRYLNFSGAAVVWDAPGEDARTAGLVRDLLAAGQVGAGQIGPWPYERPPLPDGHNRVSFLCDTGLHFGQGPADELMREDLLQPVVMAGARLMQVLFARSGTAPR